MTSNDKAINIYQYWNKVKVPKGVIKKMNSWSNKPKFRLFRFNYFTAKTFIKRNFDSELVKLFSETKSPEIRSNIFRYCILFIKGGIYIDPNIKLLPEKFNLFKILIQKSENGLIFSRNSKILSDIIFIRKPKSPLLRKVINVSIQNINNSKFNTAWELSGGSILTKLAASKLKEDSNLFRGITLQDHNYLQKIVEFKWDLNSIQKSQLIYSKSLSEILKTTIPKAKKDILTINNSIQKFNIPIHYNINYNTYKNVILLVEPGLDGIILDKNYYPIDSQFKHIKPKIFQKFLRKVKKGKLVEFDIKSVNITFNSAWKNYFHFHCLVIPKWFQLKSQNANTLYLPNPNNFIKSTITSHFTQEKLRKTLAFYNIENYKLLNPGMYYCEELNIIESDISPEYRIVNTAFFQNLNIEYLKNVPNKSSYRKVFFSRKGNINKRGIPIQENKLLDKYNLKGYELIDAGKLTFAEQIKLINECSHIAGVHGAALTNILFTTNQLNVTEFTSIYNEEKYLRDHFKVLSDIKGHNYKMIEI